MTISMDIEDRDLGWKRAKLDLARLEGLEVAVGLFDPEQAENGARHEFGTASKIPSRPWLSIAADDNTYEIADDMGNAIGKVADGDAKPRPALRPVAKMLVAATKSVITNRQVGGPPLADSTVRSKGHDQKLKDTGKMLRSIKGKVRKASEAE